MPDYTSLDDRAEAIWAALPQGIARKRTSRAEIRNILAKKKNLPDFSSLLAAVKAYCDEQMRVSRAEGKQPFIQGIHTWMRHERYDAYIENINTSYSERPAELSNSLEHRFLSKCRERGVRESDVYRFAKSDFYFAPRKYDGHMIAVVTYDLDRFRESFAEVLDEYGIWTWTEQMARRRGVID